MSDQQKSSYANRFRELLRRVEPAKLELGVQILMRKMRERITEGGVSEEVAFERTYAHAEMRVEAMLDRARECEVNFGDDG